MKLANCKEHPDANRPDLPCWTLRHDDLRRVTSQEMLAIVQSMPDLDPVIAWLENGCDPKEAAKELRIYQQRMRSNVEVTGAARLHRAASRERSERGRPPG